MLRNKKLLFVTVICLGTIAAQSFAQKEKHEHNEKAVNLKVLPKDISEDDLHKVMRDYSRSLGVRCNFCHVAQEVPGQQHPKFDFAADDKKEKEIARDMMRMVADINSKYLGKMGNGKLDPITCVSCHNGRISPIVSVDSLAPKAGPNK